MLLRQVLPRLGPRHFNAHFGCVDDFRRFEESYRGKKLPEQEFFENTLFREFSIPRERVKTFIDVFTSNLNYLHAFQPDRGGPGPVIENELRPREPDIPGHEDGGSGHQFLDTCFVMMPFGQWMDIYYREIYVPAMKEAGLEPVRADELFSTGSVIEQIWEQTFRAKVLLADLTGKNANVFMSLAWPKPLTSRSYSLRVSLRMSHLIFDI